METHPLPAFEPEDQPWSVDEFNTEVELRSGAAPERVREEYSHIVMGIMTLEAQAHDDPENQQLITRLSEAKVRRDVFQHDNGFWEDRL